MERGAVARGGLAPGDDNSDVLIGSLGRGCEITPGFLELLSSYTNPGGIRVSQEPWSATGSGI